MRDSNLDLFAHLMRRAGFGANRDELEVMAARSYESVVEDLVNPERFPEIEEDVAERYFTTRWGTKDQWLYRMVNTQRPLEEKVALFWHHVFATADSKTGHVREQVHMFRQNGLSDLTIILNDLSRNPAMICWLDNNENMKGQPNENFGRELLELFSMGVGNYTEEDVKSAALAFTGWSHSEVLSDNPTGPTLGRFKFREDQHDDCEKSFLGHRGNLTGEQVIDIIVKQEATARFISRHMYSFFVADEAQVAAWQFEPPRDPEAIEVLRQAYFDSGADIRYMLKVLLNSDFFKEARFKRVKSPAELVAGVVRMVGTHGFPEPDVAAYKELMAAMGQEILNPPSVEGWHTGREWIDGGGMTERINFAVEEFADAAKPGVAAIIDRLDEGSPLEPDEFVDRCLDLVGPVEVEEVTKQALLEHARVEGPVSFASGPDREKSGGRAVRMFQLIVSTGEFQFA